MSARPVPRLEHSRQVEQVLPAQPASDGAGVRLARNLGPALHRRLDPFLMLDEFKSDRPDDYIAGFPDHPHRGFQTVTYMLVGAMRHRDSRGNTGHLRGGDVQWMKAARGIIHSEMPEQEEGLMHGFQLWINLPAAEKMEPASYEDIAAARIPEVEFANRARAKVIAGTFEGVHGPAPSASTAPLYLDLAIPAGARLAVPLPSDHNGFVYVYDGEASIGMPATHVSAAHLAVLGNDTGATGIEIAAPVASRLLLLAGRPVGEPIVQYGPFVMNTREEIERAFADYKAGRLDA